MKNIAQQVMFNNPLMGVISQMLLHLIWTAILKASIVTILCGHIVTVTAI